MSRVDDRIRRELRRSTPPVDGTVAFERVHRRRRRHRIARRVRIVTTTAAVVGTAVAGVVGLRAVLERGPRGTPGTDVVTPSHTPEPTLEWAPLCGASSSIADLDGDGPDDAVRVGVPLPRRQSECGDVTLDAYVARLELGTGTDEAITYEAPLAACEVEATCWVLATPDLDRDGRAEVAIVTSIGASTINFALYRFDVLAPDGPLRRLEIAEPGDLWDETFGFAPGPATFSWYGSVTHQHWASCDEDPEHRFAVLTAVRDQRDPNVQHVHGVLFRLEDTALVVEFTWDKTVPDGSLEYPPDLCGSPMGSAPPLPG